MYLSFVPRAPKNLEKSASARQTLFRLSHCRGATTVSPAPRQTSKAPIIPLLLPYIHTNTLCFLSKPNTPHTAFKAAMPKNKGKVRYLCKPTFAPPYFPHFHTRILLTQRLGREKSTSRKERERQRKARAHIQGRRPGYALPRPHYIAAQ